MSGDELVDIYRTVAAGEHPDWDEFREAIVTEKRLRLHLTSTRSWGWLAGAERPPPVSSGVHDVRPPAPSSTISRSCTFGGLEPTAAEQQAALRRACGGMGWERPEILSRLDAAKGSQERDAGEGDRCQDGVVGG